MGGQSTTIDFIYKATTWNIVVGYSLIGLGGHVNNGARGATK